MYGSKISVTFDRGIGPIEISMGPVADEKVAAKTFTEFFADSRTRFYLSPNFPFAESNEADYFKSAAVNPDLVTWMAHVDGKLIGSVALHAVDLINQHAEIGIVIGDKNYWGKGIARVLEAMVLEYAFRIYIPGGLHKIICKVYIHDDENGGNLASKKAIESLGFKTVGVQKDQLWKNGRWVDVWIGEILNSEWQACRAEVLKKIGVTKFNLFPGCEDVGKVDEIVE